MPQRHRTFARGEVFPSYIVNTVLAGLSTLDHNFRIVRVNDTTIEVPAGADDAMAAISVDGNLRWRESPAQAAHPGGVAGTYDIFVTASANDIDAIPAPNTDNTDYAFALTIVASGGTPGGVDHHRKVGSLVWDGAKITAIVPEVGRSVRAPAIHAPYAERPPASALLDGVRFFASDKLMEWECVGGGWVLLFAYAPRVAALPASPIDGQECKFDWTPDGGFWHLRYQASSARWWMVGGGAISLQPPTYNRAANTDDQIITGSLITIPLDGSYRFRGSVPRVLTQGGGTPVVFLSYALNGVSQWGQAAAVGPPVAGGESVGLFFEEEADLEAADVIALLTEASTAGAHQFRQPAFVVEPIYLTP